MVNKIIKAVLTLLGIPIGLGIVALITEVFDFKFAQNNNYLLYIYVGAGLIGGLILFLSSSGIIRLFNSIVNKAEGELQKIPASDIILGSSGLIVGLIIAYLLSIPVLNLSVRIPYVGGVLSTLLYILLGYLGMSVTTKKREDFSNIANIFKKNQNKSKNTVVESHRIMPKVLDTSVIIDGRISDICETGFIEGPLVIPEFVLEELRHIADSSDSLKRTRGRRGLDILNKIQKEINIEVIIHDKDFDDIAEVDSKLLKLAQVIDGKVVTNDFNLNKVAEFHGVEVLNINELANAVKPVVLPGEEMVVMVVKDGKESGQGVAYLDDGTMIVVDSGRKHIGETIGVMVTSVLQTAAGRMIFAKPKYMVDKAV